MSLAAVLFSDDVLAHGEEKDRIASEDARAAAHAVAAALARGGFETVEVASGLCAASLAARLAKLRPAVVFNLCESFGGDSKLEAAAAGLLELLRLPYTGNRPLTLALAQDKAVAKEILSARGLPVSRSAVLSRADGPLTADLVPPLFVKTRFEDASHGISERSVCATVGEARARAGYLIETYAQDALVEEFLPGREFNVGVLFEGDVLPLAEVDYRLPAGVPQVLIYEAKWVKESPWYGLTPVKCPAENVPEPLAARLRELARDAYRALGCRDYARVDMRLDAGGAPRVLEVNPNPDISPDAGLARAAGFAGIGYDELVERIVGTALKRHG